MKIRTNRLVASFIFCILILLVTGGCVSKIKLIVTPLKTTKVKLSQILKEFENSEFEIVVNRKYDVYRYLNSVIVHASNYQSYLLASKIRKKLLDQNLVKDIELKTFRHQNHSFTKNSIGVFIVEEEGVNLVGDKTNFAPAETIAFLESRKSDYQLGHMYSSYDCDFENDITYRFWGNNSFEMEVRNFDNLDGKVDFYEGHWIHNIQNEELYINYGFGKALSFTPVIKRFFSNDGWVMRRALEFKYSTDEVLTGRCNVYLVDEPLDNPSTF